MKTMIPPRARAGKRGIAPDYAQLPYCQKHLIPFLKWLLRRHRKAGGVTEIRAIAEKPAKMIWSGYFDPRHLDELVQLLLPQSDSPRAKIPFGETPVIGEANFYFTMQPANPALLARSAYEFGRCQGTSDADIIGYQLFAIDVDPVRPSGIASTDAEKQAACRVATAVYQWLKVHEIRAIPADSGNGYHLLIPTILYEDVATASARARELLQMLDKQFSDEQAKVDTTIYNPGRILKLYGTRSVKGSDLPERPHRFAKIDLAHIPPDVDLFGALEPELAAFRKSSEAVVQAKATPKPPGRASSVPGSLDGWDADTSSQVLATILEKSGLPFRVKEKEGDRFYEFRDCPHHDDPDGHTYECCVIVRGDGSFAAKCQHDPKAAWKNFKALIQWDQHVGSVLDSLGLARKTVPYRATATGFVYLKPSRDGIAKVPLTNFTAQIIGDIAEDDGVEVRHTFEIEAQLHGRTTRFFLPAAEFMAMNWPLERLGAEAVVFAGQGNKDHARTAIQLLSGEVPTQVVYSHLGWRKHDGQYVYLHAGGAIGKDGPVEEVRVHLTDPFTRFALPRVGSNEDLARAVRASLRLLEVAPDAITVPLFAGIWRAEAGGTDFSQHLVGQSGTFKTALAALVQQHWGAELDARRLPASWASTANANEALAFLGKDAVLVVDDFAPTGSTYDVQKAHREADRLLRGQGNNSGRDRMRADATLRPTKPPRGMILSTGEDIPRGQSLRARIFVLEVAPGAVNLHRLTRRQRDAAAGLYAVAVAGFVRWLARRYDRVHHQFMPELLPHFRELASTSEQHRRTPTIVADLYLGMKLFTRYAKSCGVLTDKESDELLQRSWTALGEAASAQTAIQTGNEPVQRFLELLNAAVAAGKAHIAAVSGGKPPHAKAWGWRPQGERWEARGDRVGWLDGNNLYLEPEAAFVAAQRLAHEGGDPLAIGSKTLHKRLHEQQMLVSIDTQRGRLIVRRTLESKPRGVLHLRAAVLNPA